MQGREGNATSRPLLAWKVLTVNTPQTHINLKITGTEAQGLFNVEQQTGLTRSELIRRMLDHCLQDHVLNILVPSQSGHLTAGAFLNGRV